MGCAHERGRERGEGGRRVTNLIVSQVHVKHVEFHCSHCVQQQADVGQWHEVSRNVEKHACFTRHTSRQCRPKYAERERQLTAMAEARFVDDESDAAGAGHQRKQF